MSFVALKGTNALTGFPGAAWQAPGAGTVQVPRNK